MRISLATDWHFHEWADFSRQVEFEGRIINSRLLEAIMLFRRYTSESARLRSVVMAILGDLFHHRVRLEVRLFNIVFQEFLRAAELEIPIWLLVGNHDLESKKTGKLETSIFAFDAIPGVKVISEPTVMKLKRHRFYCLPYIEDAAELEEGLHSLVRAAQRRKSGRRILLYHGIIKGASLGAIRARDGLPPRLLEKFDFTFAGDVHIHQILAAGKAAYVGAPMQHNFGDAGQERGFITYKPKSNKWKFRKMKSPQFRVSTRLTSALRLDGRGHYVRFRPSDEEEREAAMEHLQNGKARFQVEPSPSEFEAFDIDTKKKLTPEALIKKWVTTNASGKKKRKKLMDTGLAYLRGENQ